MTFWNTVLAWFVGFLMGGAVGALVAHYWEEIVDRVIDWRNDLDPEEVAERRARIGQWIKEKAVTLFLLFFALFVVLVLVFSSGGDDQKVVPIDGFTAVQDACGNTHNVQIKPAHLSQGFIVVAPNTECARSYPLAPAE